MRNRFNVGDIIVGNENAYIYSITGVGARCKVVKIVSDCQTDIEDCELEDDIAPPDIRVNRLSDDNKKILGLSRGYEVASCLFDLVTPVINLEKDLFVKQIKNIYKTK